MSNRTIWNVMKTYNEEGVYYQVLPCDVRVIYDLLRLKNEIRQAISFLKNSRWTEEKAYKVAERMQMCLSDEYKIKVLRSKSNV